jgi:probable F420-dependent oxidoreductase
VKIDAIINGDLADAAETARRVEDLGYDGAMCAEVAHDPFLPLALAASVTERITLTTGIAVAFARNPMTVAVTASDIHRLSRGRFVLGLGSQIKPHITKRFSMPWSSPAPRMREFIGAVRSIWATWNDGAPLRFRGEFYRHTLMTPMFDQGASEFGSPPIYLAAVGPVMTAVAGEVADGLLAHAFTTPDYFRSVTLAHLDHGLASAGRTRADVEVSVPLFMIVGSDDAEIDARKPAARQQLAFYGSTPAYRPVLEHHGWGELGDELNRLSKQGEWVKMGDAIDDAVLDTFVIMGDAPHVAGEIRRRFGDTIDRIQVGMHGSDPERAGALVDALRSS